MNIQHTAGVALVTPLKGNLTTRADDSHATPVISLILCMIPTCFQEALRKTCQVQVRFFGSSRIKPHNPLVVRLPVNSFEF